MLFDLFTRKQTEWSGTTLRKAVGRMKRYRGQAHHQIAMCKVDNIHHLIYFPKMLIAKLEYSYDRGIYTVKAQKYHPIGSDIYKECINLHFTSDATNLAIRIKTQHYIYTNLYGGEVITIGALSLAIPSSTVEEKETIEKKYTRYIEGLGAIYYLREDNTIIDYKVIISLRDKITIKKNIEECYVLIFFVNCEDRKCYRTRSFHYKNY